MKKSVNTIVFVLLLLTIIFANTGCNQPENKSTDTPPATTTTPSVQRDTTKSNNGKIHTNFVVDQPVRLSNTLAPDLIINYIKKYSQNNSSTVTLFGTSYVLPIDVSTWLANQSTYNIKIINAFQKQVNGFIIVPTDANNNSIWCGLPVTSAAPAFPIFCTSVFIDNVKGNQLAPASFTSPVPETYSVPEITAKQWIEAYNSTTLPSGLAGYSDPYFSISISSASVNNLDASATNVRVFNAFSAFNNGRLIIVTTGDANGTLGSGYNALDCTAICPTDCDAY